MSMYRHLPEKDGILACLLVAEMVARTGKKLNQLIEEMYAGVRLLLLEAHRHEAHAAAQGIAGREARQSAEVDRRLRRCAKSTRPTA